MAVERIVVVGAEVAGHSCAFALRRLGYERALDLIGAAPVAAHDRKLLSKEMRGSDAGAFPLSLPQAYADPEVRLLVGVACILLSPTDRLLFPANGTTLTHDRLILGTGGTAILAHAMNAGGMLTQRILDSAVALRAVLSRSRHLVLGCGLIGGEAAPAAAGRCAVTIVEAAAAPFADAFGGDIGCRIVALHRSAGVKVITGTGVRVVTRERGGHAVALDDRRVLLADAVVVGVGMRLTTGLLGGSSVAPGDWMLTDERCEATAPDIFAAGDCARWPNGRYGGVAMGVEHWDTGRRHGAAAAANALGANEPFDPLPYFWLDQHSLKLQAVGHGPRWNSIEIYDDNHPAQFVRSIHTKGASPASWRSGAPTRSPLDAKELMAQVAGVSVG